MKCLLDDPDLVPRLKEIAEQEFARIMYGLKEIELPKIPNEFIRRNKVALQILSEADWRLRQDPTVFFTMQKHMSAIRDIKVPVYSAELKEGPLNIACFNLKKFDRKIRKALSFLEEAQKRSIISRYFGKVRDNENKSNQCRIAISAANLIKLRLKPSDTYEDGSKIELKV